MAGIAACSANSTDSAIAEPPENPHEPDEFTQSSLTPDGLARATFAGGCFWCLEPPFEKLEGVEAVVSGYTGGFLEDPAYEQVRRKQSGHREAVQVLYDPEKISYKKLLSVYWQQFDPTDAGGSFVDRGEPYTSGIFVYNEEQQRLAEESREVVAESGLFDEPIVTPIEKAGPFYKAEAYHQDFYKKSPARYNSYRRGSGRDPFIQKHWDTRPELFDAWLSRGSEAENDGLPENPENGR